MLTVKVALPRPHAGITQRPRRAFQRQQLHRIDGFHRAGGDAEAGRVEHDFVEEAAPARVHLVARVLVRIEIQGFIPAILGHFGNRAFQTQYLAPEIVRAVDLRQDHADADNRDITWAGTALLGGVTGGQMGQQIASSLTDIEMQLLHPKHLVVQGCNLSDHVHAAQLLRRLIKLHDLAAGVAITSFGGDAQAPHIQVFQLVADIVGRFVGLQQRTPLTEKLAGELGVGTAGGMARAGFQAASGRAGQRFVLKAWHDGTGFHDLAGEQIGRAHKHADLHAALNQRCGQCRDHGGGARIVDASGKEQMDICSLRLTDLGQQHFNHLLPQREAGNRTDVPTAFAPFEHESPCALFQIQLEQRRRGRVQVGRNSA